MPPKPGSIAKIDGRLQRVPWPSTRARAAAEPLDVDLSDWGDDYVAGFLAGQVNTIDWLAAQRPVDELAERSLADLVRAWMECRAAGGHGAMCPEERAVRAAVSQ